MQPLQRVLAARRSRRQLPTAVFAGGDLSRAAERRCMESADRSPKSSASRRSSARGGAGAAGFITTGVLRASFTAEEIEAAQALAGPVRAGARRRRAARARAVGGALARAQREARGGRRAGGARARTRSAIRSPPRAVWRSSSVRDPASPHTAEHAELILAELGRVERQVQALLRFARRESSASRRGRPRRRGALGARAAARPPRSRRAASRSDRHRRRRRGASRSREAPPGARQPARQRR